MPQPRIIDVVSHWHHGVDGFQTSALDFYTAVENVIEQKELPDVGRSRFDWREHGPLSAKREYLRVKWEDFVIDVCAAPFGKTYFFSWWLAATRPSPWLALALVGLLVGSRQLSQRFLLPLFSSYDNPLRSLIALIPGPFSLGLWLIVFLLVLLGLRLLGVRVSRWFRAIPVLGPLYDTYFRQETYYRADTAAMFMSAIHSAVCEVMDELTTAKGLRALSDDERKPIFRELSRRA